MTARLAEIWRHPIKSHGREALVRASLGVDGCLPWDRTWAVTHEHSRKDVTGWIACANFSIGTRAPALQAIRASLEEGAGRITLTHPALVPLTFHPDTEPQHLIEWLAPLMSPDRARPSGILRIDGRGMTDTEYPSVSLINRASNDGLAAHLGQQLSPLRWRGNLLLDGLEPWAERDWIGRRLRIGTAELLVVEPIERCLATAANTDTGLRDADTLGGLDRLIGARHMGIYARVVVAGEVTQGAPVQVLP